MLYYNFTKPNKYKMNDNFFESETYSGVTLSGVPYTLKTATVAVLDAFLKDLQQPGGEKKAFQNLVKNCLVSLGNQKGNDIQVGAMLSEDVSDMVVRLRALSLGEIFDYTHTDFGMNISIDLQKDVTAKPYAWASGENPKTYNSYADMLAENHVQETELGGKKIKWKLPLMGGLVNTDSGVLAALADARNATFERVTENPATKEKTTLPERIDWPNAPLKLLDAFCKTWKAVEGKTDTLMTINSRDGKAANVNIIALPGFFSTALVQ